MIPFAAGRRAFLVALALAIIGLRTVGAQEGAAALTPPAAGTFHPVS